MNREDFYRQRDEAIKLMRDDYQWLMSQEPAIYRWRCPKCWLIEFVYDANQQRPLDDLLRPVRLKELYKRFFENTLTNPPNHPSIQLSKLRAMEQRNDIRPDSITLYYMKQMQKSPKCRIIELLMELE